MAGENCEDVWANVSDECQPLIQKEHQPLVWKESILRSRWATVLKYLLITIFLAVVGFAGWYIYDLNYVLDYTPVSTIVDALKRERAQGEVAYWTATKGKLGPADRLKTKAVNPSVATCSEGLSHSGRSLGDLVTDLKTWCKCNGHSLDDVAQPACCIARKAALLEYTAWTLPRFNISFWLGHGVLLGAVREGGFIGHDWDIDLGILREPEDVKNMELWIAQAAKDGIRTETRDFGYVSELGDAAGSNTGMDLGYHAAKSSDPHRQFTDKQQDAIFPVEPSCNFHGFLMPCPHNPKELVHQHVGDTNPMVPTRWDGKHALDGNPRKDADMADIQKGIDRSVECLTTDGWAHL